jgi:hypothetical protein
MTVDSLLPALQVGQPLATAYTSVASIIGHVPSVAAPTIQYPLADGHRSLQERTDSGNLRLVVSDCGGNAFCLNARQFKIVDEDPPPESDDVYRTSCDVGT